MPTLEIPRAAPRPWKRAIDAKLLVAAHMLTALERSVLDQVDGASSDEAIAKRLNEGVGAVKDVLRRLSRRGLISS